MPCAANFCLSVNHALAVHRLVPACQADWSTMKHTLNELEKSACRRA